MDIAFLLLDLNKSDVLSFSLRINTVGLNSLITIIKGIILITNILINRKLIIYL